MYLERKQLLVVTSLKLYNSALSINEENKEFQCTTPKIKNKLYQMFIMKYIPKLNHRLNSEKWGSDRYGFQEMVF